MTDYKKLLSYLIEYPTRLLTKSKLVLGQFDKLAQDCGTQPIFYVLKHDSITDLLVLKRACKQAGLPNPFKPVKIGEQLFRRYVCLDKLQPVLQKQAGETDAKVQIQTVLNLHNTNHDLDAKLIPCFVAWGRAPGIETNNIKTLFNDQRKPSWLKKLFIVLFSGRDNFISINEPLSIRHVVEQYGSDAEISHKLLRVARFHFQRQRLAMAGPRLWQRDNLITSLLASPVIKKAIDDEAKSKNISLEKARQTARQYLNEMSADYRESHIRLLDRIMTWVWNKLYSGLEVKNGEAVRKLAQDGHELVYVPCHRSHMDYLLLTYVIYYQGLVPPHIAAGVNLNFWPMGPIFRRAGAFFIRRSFRGNKLYSETFREYLAQLISKGYAIKFYPESGRSRTGRLLKPKTGMLAMTVQTMLRNLERPVTLVPVYIGYEHVMEVKTYLRELKGEKKKKESWLHLFSIIKNLRHFGRGYVNFGQPIQLNKDMTEYQPDWKKDCDPYYPPKPAWLNGYITDLSDKIMRNINHAAALNGVTLTAMTLALANKHTLFRDDLESQLKLLIDLHQSQSPFDNMTLPPETDTTQLVEHALKMEKFVEEKGEQTTISIAEEQVVEMSYYRNNIIHLYVIPSIIAALLLENNSVDKQRIHTVLQLVAPILGNEYFFEIEQEALDLHIDHCLQTMQNYGLVEVNQQTICAVDHAQPPYLQLHLLSSIAQETLQRYAIVLQTIETHPNGLSRSELERTAQEAAKYLAKMHDIKGPEFTDKSILTQFVGELKSRELIVIKEEGRFIGAPALAELSSIIYDLIDGDVFNTIRHASSDKQ
ncbi:glycerol-3-phosphate acyltransferase [Catenovulum agarivorans DS-2]|uniref:Glycerol-3-phosphate acyltransferase n=1 Tax=Catenovulum agarivorans DS-2 TaxID=1328313 RepID=W7QKT6_9ALTE|nr:glycerol-3-phosphate 1-O-acyltransferase PlsB [Catenovulum agarivorans]EWH08688.1 glycerol-3-phosphate acyltransferase [Catenovulum agarivorans DS-2]